MVALSSIGYKHKALINYKFFMKEGPLMWTLFVEHNPYIRNFISAQPEAQTAPRYFKCSLDSRFVVLSDGLVYSVNKFS